MKTPNNLKQKNSRKKIENFKKINENFAASHFSCLTVSKDF